MNLLNNSHLCFQCAFPFHFKINLKGGAPLEPTSAYELVSQVHTWEQYRAVNDSPLIVVCLFIFVKPPNFLQQMDKWEGNRLLEGKGMDVTPAVLQYPANPCKSSNNHSLQPKNAKAHSANTNQRTPTVSFLRDIRSWTLQMRMKRGKRHSSISQWQRLQNLLALYRQTDTLKCLWDCRCIKWDRYFL